MTARRVAGLVATLVLFLAIAGISHAKLAGPHNAASGIGCYNYCHILPDVKSPYWNWVPADIDDTPTNHLCNSCHTRSSGPYSMTNAPAVQTHSSLTTDDGYGNWTIGCTSCHSPHYQEQLEWLKDGDTAIYLATGELTAASYNSGTGESLLTYSSISYKTGWNAAGFLAKTLDYRRVLLIPDTSTLLPDTSDNLSFQVIAIDADAKTITVRGDVTETPALAGLPADFGVMYGQLLRQYVKTPAGWNKPVKFYDKTAAGDGGFTDQDDLLFPKGVCQVCHTQTSHWRSDGSRQNHYTDRACMECHDHTNGFAHGGGGGTNCETCHGHDAGYEYTPGQFSAGAGSFQSHSTHTENDTDDAKGPHIACSGCHDTNNFPYFKSGTDANSDGKYTLAETDVCNTCHSPGGTYDGVNNATYGAKALWDAGAYAATNDSTLQAGKEKWCATCHDEVASVIGGITAPNVVGDEDGAYTYGAGWGYYKTGHGLPTATSYASSGGRVYGAGKECADCHDYSFTHTDGNARTYSAASNNYQAGYRLKNIDGYPPMDIPLPQNIDNHDPGHYALCFACHDSNRYLLKTPNPVTTSFRDDLDLGPWDGGDPPINIHEYHLNLNSLSFDSDWSGGGDSLISCVNCHNVHGSTQLSMVRDGHLVGGDGMPVYYDNVLTPPTVTSATVPSPITTLDQSTGTLFRADSLGDMCGNCHGGQWAKWYRTPPSAPAAPTLDWTGEANYTTDGVNPNSGQGGDYFTFRIKYTDANRQIPRAIQVWVDENDNGTYDDNEKHNMYEVDSSDIDVSDGKLYRAILPVASGGDGTLTYRFFASDGKFDATGAPTHATSNTISVSNNAPVLAWTGEAGYTADGVNPNSAAAGSSFTFRVRYTDVDNNAPSSIQLWLDKNDDGDYLDAGEKIDMTAADGDDTTYTDGKIYTKDVAIAAAGDNTLNYRFSASDGQAATGVPTVDKTVSVTTSNSAPTLAWTGETNYILDGVNPDAGVGGTTFTFRVNYTDIDNNPPSSIQVWVDKNDDDDFLDAGEKLDMTAVDAEDTEYTDGKIYTKSVTIPEAGDGIISYRFSASDGTAEATGTPVEGGIVTILMSAIKVSCPGVGDYDYTTIQEAINNAVNGDTILVADGTCTERITIDNKDLTIKSVNGAASTTINGSAGGVVVTLTNGADTVFEGLTITNGYKSSGYGAGVSATNSSPTLRNCFISNNQSQYGAGIYMASAGTTLTLTDSTLTGNNTSLNGAAMYLASGTSANISGTTFHNNWTGGSGRGGAIGFVTSANANLTISSTTFTKNTANIGGAIYGELNGGTANLSFDGCTFTASDTTDSSTIAATRNSSSNRGGTIHLTDSGATTSLNISDTQMLYGHGELGGGALHLTNLDATAISDSLFASNTAGGSGDSGPALYVNNGSANTLTITDSIIRDNTSDAAYGGAMRISGGVNVFERTKITGNQCVQRGGAAYISGAAGATATTTIRNCIVSGNKASSFEGGAFYLTDDGNSSHTVNIINSTLSGNYAGTYGGGLHCGGTAAVTIKNSILWRNRAGLKNYEINGTATASYSNIRQTGFSGNNNLNINPLFVDEVSYASAPTSSGDYHLLLGSPVIDTGTATGAPADDIDNNVRPIAAAHDMGADEVVTVSNTAPTLTWTGEANFTGDGVNPDLAASGSSFEFRVNYADDDNDAPSVIQVWIDKNDDGDYLDAGEKLTMTAVDGGDTTYSDGKLYTRTETLSSAGDGALTYRFSAADGYEAATGAPTAGRTVTINSAPTLAWVGSGNYISDGVHPDSGTSGTSFEFRVTYTDANNDQPKAIQVWVDKNDGGDYLDAGEKFTMNELDPGDTVCSDGKVYYRTVPLTKAGDGVLNYRFYASDGQVATGTPTGNKTLTVSNNIPALAWTGEAGYTTDGVNPNVDIAGSSFTFRVKYTDADNEAPPVKQVWVDADNSGVYDAGEKYDMTEVDAGDTTFTDGKLYTKSLTLNTSGTIKYKFVFNDGTDTASGAPAGDSTLTVSGANTPPDLSWTGESGYTTDGVNPDSGPGGANFTFRVKYTDTEDQAPTSIQVWVDKNDNSSYAADEKFEMTAVDAGDTVYTDGKLYTYTLAIPYAGDGSLNYRFYAHDGYDPATGSATADKTMTVVNPITVCKAGHADAPCSFTSIQAAINDAGTTNGKFVKVSADTYSENINFNGKNITIYSKNGAASTTIQGSGANSPVVTFSTSENASAVLDGFTINNQGNSTSTRGISVSGATPTIKNCIIEGNDAPNAAGGGGGVYITNSAPTFDSCVIRANSTLNRSGGGIYITGAASGATFTNCTIGGDNAADQNYSNNGSAGAIYFGGSTSGALTITNSTIKNNVAATDGPGIYLTGITNVTTITGSTVSYNNTSNGHGGGIFSSGSPVRVTNSHIDYNSIPTGKNGAGIYLTGAAASLVVESNSSINNNTQAAAGGGIYITGSTAAVPLSISNSTLNSNTAAQGGAGIQMSTLTNTSSFTNVTVNGNTASNNYGGGIYAIGAPFTMTGSTITNNTAPGIRTGGGICIESTTADISSSTIESNTAGGGGGIGIRGTAPTVTLTRVKVQGNHSNNNLGGGGIRHETGTATITNSIIAGNISPDGSSGAGGGGIYSSATLNLYFSTIADNYAGRYGGGLRASGTETVRNSIIWGNVNPGAGGTEIYDTAETLYLTESSTDPHFVARDTANSTTPKTGGNYRLQADSNCIDTGDATNAPADDLDGKSRPIDISGKGDGVADYDKGAYEYGP